MASEEIDVDVSEKIERLITLAQYEKLVGYVGETYANKIVKGLTERFVPLSHGEIKRIQEEQTQKRNTKRSRLDTIEESRKATGVNYKHRDTGVPDLESESHDEFVWDSVIYVDGHSELEEGDRKDYSNLGDLSVVTIVASSPGDFCFASNYAIQKIMEDIYTMAMKRQGKKFTPMDVAILLNTRLREDPLVRKHIDKDADADTFLRSSVKISESTSQYYEREWDFFELRIINQLKLYKNIGSVTLHDTKGVHSLFKPGERDFGSKTTLNKTEILKRALEHGIKRPLFIDVGCLNFKTEKARELWSAPVFVMGGSTKRPQIKKLRHFTKHLITNVRKSRRRRL